jgi:trans-aconitate 2-methyltransferase
VVTREWDAPTYDALSIPHEEWGERTLARLELRGDETVLDAGAGTGRDTDKLLDRLPHGRVVAVDGSQAMLDRLAQRIGDDERVQPLRWHLTTPLPPDVGPFEAVFSVATFHWILDHDVLFTNLAARTGPGGRLVAECGGAGNVSSIDRAVADVLGRSAPSRWHFADVATTRERLRAAGFEPVEVRLRPHPITLEGPDRFRTYLATIVLGSHLDAMTDAEGDEFLAAVAARLDRPTVDYVRLEITARRDDGTST